MIRPNVALVTAANEAYHASAAVTRPAQPPALTRPVWAPAAKEPHHEGAGARGPPHPPPWTSPWGPPASPMPSRKNVTASAKNTSITATLTRNDATNM